MLANKFINIVLLSIIFSISSQVIAKDSVKESRTSFYSELENFTRIFNTIKYNYVDEFNNAELFNKAIKGMMLQLDPHSSYLEPKEKDSLLENSSGKFGGLGIVITMADGLVKIISPIDDTPAYRAGLEAGDLIFKINDTSVRNLDLSEAVGLMRGVPGTTVTISISREDTEPFSVEITRDIITIISVKGYLLEEDVAYIRISSFQAPSADLLQKSLDDIIVKNNKPIKALVLDLRNNPGGLLNSAIGVSDLFLDDKGLIVYTKGRVAMSNIEHYSTVGDIINGTPIAVLINRGSASASEIVAGALQDHNRAIIIGEKSFGKGSVQTVSALKNGYGLKFTTARYYTPLDRSIQAKGIEPDIILKRFELKEDNKDKDLSTSEKNLKGHIDATKTITATASIAIKPQDITKTLTKDASASIITEQELQKEQRDAEAVVSLQKDYYVNQAINILKAMNIWQK